MKRIVTGSAAMLALLAIAGCGGGNTGGAVTPKTDKNGVTVGEQLGGPPVTKEAADAFSNAVSDFKKHEDARDWDDAACTSVAGEFLAAGKAQGGKFPAAHYNAGVTMLHCGHEDEASTEFETALSEAADLAAASSDPKVKGDPVFHEVWVQKALIRYRKGDVPGISEAIDLIINKGFDNDGSRNVEAFVNLGMLYRERWTKDPTNKDRTGKDKLVGLEDDLARSQFWLQNALSIDDAFMPAYNQLALYYLDKARFVGQKNFEKAAKTATKKDKENKPKADLQTLETGLLVAQEASRRDPGYAGIWNTQGLILLEIGRTGAATQAFKLATEKDAKFFEAWMNYAAINLAFRGYGEAATGYKSALGIHPKDYDASLGFAVSTRGQLDFALTSKQAMERRLSECTDPDKASSLDCQQSNKAFPGQIKDFGTKFVQYYADAEKAYDVCVALDAGRAEAFFDKALLVEKYKAKAQPEKTTTQAAYEQAAGLYEDLASKFAGNPKYGKLVDDAKSRGVEARKSAKFEADSAAAAAAPPPAPPPPASSSAPPAGSSSVKKP